MHDDTAASVPQTIVIDTLAALPVAYAGADQLTDAQGSAIVDGGLSSGDVLDFNWSATGLTGADGVFGTPTEMITTVDLSDDGAGELLPSALQLIVADANGVSLPDTVFVGAGNIRPIVGQGADLTVTGGIATSLLASDYASDLNSDALSYRWSIVSRPDNSVLTVDPADAATQIVTGAQFDFTPDVTGLYLIQLVADDGLLAARPAVISVIVENTAPIAVAAAIADSVVGLAVTLDGSGSSDPDADALNYQWAVTTRPAGSTATIVDPTATIAHFTPDVKGNYSFALTVSDFELSSDPAVTSLTVLNQSPVISIVVPDAITIGEAAVFDASASVDSDGDPLTFTIDVTGPGGSVSQVDELPGGIFVVTLDTVGAYTIVVSVFDGEITETSTTVLTAAGANSAPILGALLDTYTVELGLELAFDLQATDVDGDLLTFYATPLPLADGISLDASTGAVRFLPEAGQEGSYTFTLGVTDGVLTDEAVVTIDVVTGTTSDTSVFGRVLDATDFANGIETPLVGMPVRLDTAGLETTTDANGIFRFSGLTAGGDAITIDPNAVGGPGGYVAIQRDIVIYADQDRDLAPEFLLTALNEGCVSVVAGQITSLVGASTGVSLEFGADTILNADGSVYSGQVCLGSLPQQTTQDGLPEDTLACQVYGVSAPGAVFSTGARISAPNFDNLPESTQLTLWENAQSTRFRVIASADVDAGAATVSAQVSLSENGLFTFLPQAPQTVASDDQPTGNHTLNVFEGDLNEVYTLPGYFAFNQAQQVGLSYHSAAADPTVIVAGDVTIVEDASLPVVLSTRIEVGGVSQTSDVTWTPREAADGTIPALIGEEVVLRQSMPVDASNLSSGRYDYDFIARAQYDCSTVTATHSADLYVQNETDSPYGVGWSIDGLQELVVADDGSVSIIDDDGIATFNPETTFTEFDEDPLVFPAVGPQGFVVDDFDNDGDADIAVADTGTGNIFFIDNLGDGEFALGQKINVAEPATVPETGVYPPNLVNPATGDFDANGASDILYGGQSLSEIGYLTSSGSGIYNLGGFVSGSGVVSLAAADLDLDGYTDIVYVSSTGVTLMYGSETGFINAFPPFAFEVGVGTSRQVALVDIDSNGFIDIAQRSDNGVFIAFNYQSTFTVKHIAVDSPSNLLAQYMTFGDYDSDGDADLVWSGDDTLQYFENVSGRVFADAVNLPRPTDVTVASPVAAIDVTGDGNLDIILSQPDSISVYNGLGDGTFEPFVEGLLGHPISRIVIEDFNQDGSLDMLSAQRFSVTIDFSRPSDTGTFFAGLGEYSTLEKLPDGSWERRYKDGMVVAFNADGLQTAIIDQQGNRREFTYGDDGRLATVVDQLDGETTFTYDVLGRLASTTYPDGRVTKLTYDDIGGTLNIITEPTGSEVVFDYDDDGRLVSTTNQNGNSSEYQYDSVGNVSAATLPDGSNIAVSVAASLGLEGGLGNNGPVSYVAPEDRVTTVEDRKGEVSQVIVNRFGSPIQTIDPLGRATRISRNSDNLVTRIERPSDALSEGVRVDMISYDNQANVIQMVEASVDFYDVSRFTKYTYDPIYNKVTSMRDPDYFTTQYEYNEFGEVTRITDPVGGERLTTYNDWGKITARTDENGNTTNYIYNAEQNLGQITYADGSITTMIYDAAGNIATVKEAVGTPIERQIQRTYDDLNRVLTIEVTGADGAQIDGLMQYTYTPAGNLATITDETGLVTVLSYDALERLITIEDPAKGTMQRVYNTAGELTQFVNGAGEVHEYTYDQVSRLTQVTDPEGFVKSFSYDVRDNVAAVIDGRLGTTTFEFDAFDRMITRTNPIGDTVNHGYDNRDNLVNLLRQDGLVDIATYDGLGRRVEVLTGMEEYDYGEEAPSDYGPAENELYYSYDPRSNLTEAVDDDSRVSFTYDERNRLKTTTTDGTFGPQPEVTISYTYDALDRRTSMSDSLGGTTSYVYDVEDRLTDLTTPWGTAYNFGYDGEGRRTSLTSTSGRDTAYGYTNGLLSSLIHAQAGVALSDLTYTHDVDGQLNAIIDNLDPTQSLAIHYDDLNRLIQVDQGVPVADGGVPIPIEDYQYDEEGNRLASHLSLLYDSNAHNQLTEDDSYTYAYDERGNRISRTDKTTAAVEYYIYDTQNRLVGYSSDITTASYAYDALDRRIAKTVDGSVGAFVYDPWSLGATSNDVVLDFEDGTLARRWQHGTRVDEPLAVEDYAGTTAPGSGSVRSFFANRLGSIVLAVSVATGAVAAEAEYDSFGAREITVGTEAEMPRYGFTGREHDAESGLIYYRARHYDPAIGQFLQRDPIGFAAGDLNLYAYVGNDPYNWTDPSGLAATAGYAGNEAQSAGIGAGVSGAVRSGLISFIEKLLVVFSKVPKIRPLLNAADAAGAGAAGGDPGNDDDNDDCWDPGEIGDLDFESSGIHGDHDTIPWTNMGVNQAYAFARRLEESINFRVMDNQTNPDADHDDRIQRDRDALEKANKKSEGHDC